MLSLKTALTDYLHSATMESPHRVVGNRPVFILAPDSFLGKAFTAHLAKRIPNIVAMIDDLSTEAEIYGRPRWSLHKFVSKASRSKDAVAIDLSSGLFTAALFKKACEEANVERVDAIHILAEYEICAVYETPQVVRNKTLVRIDDYFSLLDRLDDNVSKETLYAVLLMRLTYERTWLFPYLCNTSHEYFSHAICDDTFHLREDEIFCDAGSHVGLITAKFLGATQWRYREIHAFEPDKINYDALRKYCLLPLNNFHIHNKALSDCVETLRFEQMGNVSSHVSDSGTVEVQTTTIDSEMESLTFLKMDIEGYEPQALRGTARLIAKDSPRMAIAAYHYADDLLDIVHAVLDANPRYVFRLRQYLNFYNDTLLYASTKPGWDA